MKRLFGLTLLVLALSVVPAQAQINIGVGKSKPAVGPWYLYYPLEAYFQVPASPQYPYWPAPMTLPINQPAGQGAGGYNPNGATGGMQMPGGKGYNPYGPTAGMQNPGMGMPPSGPNGYNPYGRAQMPASNGYNPYGMGGYNPYGGMNPYQAAPQLPAGSNPNSSAPTIRTAN
jgi:hypothetical protein